MTDSKYKFGKLFTLDVNSYAATVLVDMPAKLV